MQFFPMLTIAQWILVEAIVSTCVGRTISSTSDGHDKTQLLSERTELKAGLSITEYLTIGNVSYAATVTCFVTPEAPQATDLVYSGQLLIKVAAGKMCPGKYKTEIVCTLFHPLRFGHVLRHR
ncbi:hypothetical protein FN846DRAFT_361391 [Sphaerosporella brunnea]|uniref:Uncharacterized protein n=1 Tax=Sphaerosporella brunnea TaxID=1250544 RepID=A0A5J5F5Y2_9PEZI|nr:hypothetical protein FN846DRAFT_361391 [Sphaerosporella brunnea]